MGRPMPRDELALALLGAGDPAAVERVTALLMAADEGFFSVDLRAGVISVSRSLEIAYGHRPAELGTSLDAWRSLVHPDDLPGLLESRERALRSAAGLWTEQLRFRRSDGTYALIRIRAAIVRDASGTATGLVGAVTDLSDRASDEAELRSRAEQLLERSAEARDEEARRRLIERAVDEVVWEWDIAQATVRFSSNLATFLGYRPEEVDGTYLWWEGRIHPDDAAGIRHSLAMHLVDDLPEWVATYRFRRADGSYVWVRDRGYLERGRDNEPVRMIGSMRILDERGDDTVTAELGRVHLSLRQTEVLLLVRGGASNKEIASSLGIAEQSVKEHVSRLLKKFRAPNRAALVEAAWRTEVVSDRDAPAVSG